MGTIPARDKFNSRGQRPEKGRDQPMGIIGHGYGSQFHLLRYLGYHRHDLNRAIEQQCGGRVLDWLDFSFDAHREFPLLDSEWKGLEFLGPDEGVQTAWAKFWPQTGNVPNWDAVGLLQVESHTEFILVEAKANASEIMSDCHAREGGGRPKIRKALTETIGAHGFTADPEQWLTPYYQYANRLATLHFLLQNNIPSRLVFVYFTGDEAGRYGGRVICPKDRQEWESHLQGMYNRLGMTASSELEKRVHRLFLPICGQSGESPEHSVAQRDAAGEGTVWREGRVDRASEHFGLRYGDASTCKWDECIPVALVSRDRKGTCNVEFLVERADPRNSKIVKEVLRELNLYLVELRTPDRPDPWEYLQYHCGTCSNIYSPVHWSFLSQQTPK